MYNELMPEETIQKNPAPTRDEHGRFIKSTTGVTYSTTPTTKSESDQQISTYNITKQRTDPPLLFLRFSNPITYIKRWWKRLMGNEGMELRLRVKPLTAIAIAVALGLFGFGVGRVSIPADSPIVKYVPQFLAIPTTNPWKETAFSGTIHTTNGDFYLVISESQAVTISVPSNIDLTKYIGKRILAQGLYNEDQRLLNVTSVENIELLNTKPQKIPTVVPSPALTPAPIINFSPTIHIDTPPNPDYNNPSM